MQKNAYLQTIVNLAFIDTASSSEASAQRR